MAAANCCNTAGGVCPVVSVRQAYAVSPTRQLATATGIALSRPSLAALTSHSPHPRAQGSAFLGWLSRKVPAARDRLLADPRYLFIVLSEVLIDSGEMREQSVVLFSSPIALPVHCASCCLRSSSTQVGSPLLIAAAPALESPCTPGFGGTQF